MQTDTWAFLDRFGPFSERIIIILICSYMEWDYRLQQVIELSLMISLVDHPLGALFLSLSPSTTPYIAFEKVAVVVLSGDALTVV